MLMWVIIGAIEILTLIVLEFTEFKYDTFKPLMKVAIRICMLIPAIGIVLSNQITIYSIIILIAVIVAIISDILIIYSFAFGLIGFLFCHAIVSAGYVNTGIQIMPMSEFFLIIILIIGAGIYLSLFYGKLSGFLKFGFMLYLLVMSAEIFLAVSSGKFEMLPYIVAGSILFYICDVQVAYTNFYGTFPYSQQLNHLLYYGGLYLIAISVKFA